MITVFILASRKERWYVEEFWMHLVMARRQMVGVSWASPVYIEDMLAGNALVATLPQRYIVLAFLSKTFLSKLFDEPALREMLDGALRKMPFIISPCGWNEYPSPFAGLSDATFGKVFAGAKDKDDLFVLAVQRTKQVIEEVR